MADKSKRLEKRRSSSRDDVNKKNIRRYSAVTAGNIIHSEKGKLRIGNYILGTTLGHGTFGKVKRKFIYII